MIILKDDNDLTEKDGLLQAAQSSLEFWDNTFDDEDWRS